MKESLRKIDKKCILRETFTSEDDVRRNGGIPTGVTFSGGVGSFNGTSSYIKVNKQLNGVYTFRIKLKNFTFSTNKVFIDCRNSNGLGSGTISCAGTNTLGFDSGTGYINGITSTTLITNSTDIVITGMTAKCFEIFIGCRYNTVNFVTANYELFEIYEGTLTVNEVSNLYNNRRYKPFTTKLPKILDVDAFDGVAKNRLSGGYVNGVSVPSIVNTAVTVVKDNGLNVMRFNGSTSKLDCGNYNGLTGDITISCWVKNYFNPPNAADYVTNDKLILRNRSVGQIRFFSNGLTDPAFGNPGVVPNQTYANIVVTRLSNGTATVYKNAVILNVLSSGTPVAGTTNIIIGNNSVANNGFVGKIAQLQIYSGILSANEISQLYTSTKNKYNL